MKSRPVRVWLVCMIGMYVPETPLACRPPLPPAGYRLLRFLSQTFEDAGERETDRQRDEKTQRLSLDGRAGVLLETGGQ